MNLIETLRSVGGVKPCDCGVNGIGWHHEPGVCPDCHGTGQVLDLAPLLAKPKELTSVVHALYVEKLEVTCDCHGRETPGETCRRCHGRGSHLSFSTENLVVVGPQRSHSLVYEVARQLGGTAVVAEPMVGITESGIEELRSGRIGISAHINDLNKRVVGQVSYRLSLPIPPDATVLFVTDRIDAHEMIQVINTVENTIGAPCRMLPYILCLVDYDKNDVHHIKIIKLEGL